MARKRNNSNEVLMRSIRLLMRRAFQVTENQVLLARGTMVGVRYVNKLYSFKDTKLTIVDQTNSNSNDSP